MTGLFIDCDVVEWLTIHKVNGRLADKCNQSLMARSRGRAPSFVGFPRVNERVDQSWGVDRANWRHPRQMVPRRKGVGNLDKLALFGS